MRYFLDGVGQDKVTTVLQLSKFSFWKMLYFKNLDSKSRVLCRGQEMLPPHNLWLLLWSQQPPDPCPESRHHRPAAVPFSPDLDDLTITCPGLGCQHFNQAIVTEVLLLTLLQPLYLGQTPTPPWTELSFKAKGSQPSLISMHPLGSVKHLHQHTTPNCTVLVNSFSPSPSRGVEQGSRDQRWGCQYCLPSTCCIILDKLCNFPASP